LAKHAGIAVPVSQVVNVAKKQVILLRRFDRERARRIPFLSAMSMLGSKDNEGRSYLEIADTLRQHGAAVKEDLEALWRRIVFNILISNTDDHLRNHGFLYAGQEGWRLLPAYDLNPVPVDIKPRVLTTAISEDDNTASLPLALEVAGYFDLDDAKARQIAAEVGRAVSKWRKEAMRLGITKTETDRMASAFEHDDSRAARG
jgi:serine/threonine-protein kinase HipA